MEMAHSPPSLEGRLKAQARAVGFDLIGIVPATRADGLDHLGDWLAKGYAGEMTYMRRQAQARENPSSILASVRTVVMVGINYFSPDRDLPSADSKSPPTGQVARYARGADYHDVIRAKLNLLLDWVQHERPGTMGRGVVDTAPLMERDFARRAGLGWFGKNTMLINKRLGSYTLLGALLLDIDLAPDQPFEASHCGRCTACLDSCPTDAFVGPFQLDSRRCISYLTIELRGPIGLEARPDLGDWVFGCDVCQEVCPWNRKAPAGTDPQLRPRPELARLDLLELFHLTQDQFRQRFKRTALERAKRRGLLRNAAIVLGNRGNPDALPTLEKARADPDPVIAEAVQWAIDQIHQAQTAHPEVLHQLSTEG